MRAAPPLAFTVNRLGAWRAGLAGVAALAAAAVLAWWSRSEAPAAGAWAAAGLACALLPLVEALRTRPRTLRWDGERWHVGPAGTGSDAAVPGRLDVVADAGSWLLLRFTADPDALRAARPRPFPGGGTAWVPVQRGGLEDLWHPIRCTVYSPPPAGPPRGAAAPPSQ